MRLPADESQARLARLLLDQPLVRSLLRAAAEVGLPSWYLGAGVLNQTAWNLLTGRPPLAHLADIDVVYFDPADLSVEGEAAAAARLAQAAGPLPLPLDVTNQARVHLWYPEAFGKAIPPYTSAEQAIATWPTTASSVGLTLRGSDLAFCAPFGVEDLLALRVRPNRALIPPAVYAAKSARWKACWPELSVEPW